MTDVHLCFKKLKNLWGPVQYIMDFIIGLSERIGCAVVYMPGVGSEGNEIALYDHDSKLYKVIHFVHDKRRVFPSGPKYDL